VLNVLRTQPWARKALSGLSVVLLVAGVALVGFPLATNLFGNNLQDKLGKQLKSPELEQAYRQNQVGEGDSLTRIKIPRLDVDMVVVEGISPSALRAGAGHYPQTPLPCADGNVSIAGHRTTFGKPFANVDQLNPGDTIELETPIGSCVYRVDKEPFIVGPRDVSVLNNKAEKTLTLTTCHPRGSAAQRLIVQGTWLRDGEIT
jgi:sortase A